MNLIGVLISGVRGGENGSAELYKRGTSNRATWYSSFEGDGANASGASITLDANGGAEVYVDELIDVIVKASDGSTVRSFTAGDSSPPVEVRSPSFTGASYASAASAAGNPTTLQAVLDLWLTKNGAIDWLIGFSGSTATIKAVASMLNGKLFYNVKDDAFGATGAGTNDDAAAIQAAINAANTAGGGVVLFPEGTYRITATLTVPATVHLVGMGPAQTTILNLDHATNDLLSYTGGVFPEQYLVSLQLKAAQSTSGRMILGVADTRLAAVGCLIGDGTNTTGNLVALDRFRAVGCLFMPAGATGRAFVTGSGDATFQDCRFLAPAVAYNPSSSVVQSRELRMDRCLFDLSAATSGTMGCLSFGSTWSTVKAHVTNTRVLAPTGGTAHLFNLSAASITHDIGGFFEDYNVAEGSVALYNFNATPFTGNSSAAANPGTESWNVHFGSRERQLIKVTHNATPYDLNTSEYGLIILRRTDAVAQTLTANVAIPNGKLTIMTFNDSGGAGGTITTSTGFYPGEAYSIATNVKWDVRTYQGMDMLGNMRWLTDTSPRNNI